LVDAERYDEASAVLREIRRYAKPDLAGDIRILETQIGLGLAFQRGDYETFLVKSQELTELAPEEPRAWEKVAEAHACKYAPTGRAESRAEAIAALNRARKLAEPNDKAFEKEVNRLKFRLQTREVIGRTQFEERFSNGWVQDGG
jgi:hypothetical protein